MSNHKSNAEIIVAGVMDRIKRQVAEAIAEELAKEVAQVDDFPYRHLRTSYRSDRDRHVLHLYDRSVPTGQRLDKHFAEFETAEEMHRWARRLDDALTIFLDYHRSA